MNPITVLSLKKCGLSQLIRSVCSDQSAVKFFKTLGLISLNKRKCKVCSSPMLSRPHPRTKLRCMMRCLNKVNCNYQENPLNKTWFENSNLGFRQIFDVIVHWFFRSRIRPLLTSCDIATEASIKWTKACRNVFKRKNHCGRQIKGEKVWILGGVCRETRERFAVRMKNRSRAEIMKALRKNVAKNTILVTDGYVGYNNVAKMLGFSAHEVVIHKTNFVNPIFREIHTNTVENMWGKLKRVVARTGSDEQIDMFISEYVYRSRLIRVHGATNYGAQFNEFLTDVKKLFPRK